MQIQTENFAQQNLCVLAQHMNFRSAKKKRCKRDVESFFFLKEKKGENKGGGEKKSRKKRRGKINTKQLT